MNERIFCCKFFTSVRLGPANTNTLGKKILENRGGTEKRHSKKRAAEKTEREIYIYPSTRIPNVHYVQRDVAKVPPKIHGIQTSVRNFNVAEFHSGHVISQNSSTHSGEGSGLRSV